MAPVTTIAFPTKFCGSRLTSTLPNSTPAARSFSTISRLLGVANQRTMLAAMIGPTPSVSARSASEASIIESSVPNPRLSASLADGPRPLQPSAVSNRGNGRRLDPSIALSKLSAFVSPHLSSVSSCSRVNV